MRKPEKRKAYEEKLEAQLKEWSVQIALLKAWAEVKTAFHSAASKFK